jgi:tRNA nucleotidyltransferase/poly(A) polymerase
MIVELSMKIYLVGGAVRDKLLGQHVEERDWVVVGASPETLINLGYQQVGQNFPVFLHPQTHEEYALARTEKKTSPGHQGFICDFNPEVSLEEDLKRRDLRLNAIAMDAAGHLIDPYQGQKDIENRLLHHVSTAFAEDPLRVLRVARFHAKLFHLGFRIAPATMHLMQSMVTAGELKHLSKERIWKEWQKAFLTKNPEVFLQTLETLGALQVIAPELCPLSLPPIPVNTSPENKMVLAWYYGVVANSITDKIQKFSSLAEHLNLPKRIRNLSIKYFKLRACLTKHELPAEVILSIFEQLDAFRDPNDCISCLHIAAVDQRLTHAEIKTLEQSLDACRKIKFDPIEMPNLAPQQIQAFLSAQRLHAIQKKLNRG